MRLRLFGLLLVAAAGGGLAAWVSAASAEQPPAVKPAPNPVAVSAVLCPLPNRFRPVFERAARQTKLPLALLTAVTRIESNIRRAARSRRAYSTTPATCA